MKNYFAIFGYTRVETEFLADGVAWENVGRLQEWYNFKGIICNIFWLPKINNRIQDESRSNYTGLKDANLTI